MPSYTITDTFIGAGAGQNNLTVNAYAESRFTTPPAKNAAAPDGNAPDATATTGSSYGNDGSFQLTLSAAGLYWVSVAYSGTTYWKLYNVVPVGGAVAGLTRYGTGAPSTGLGNVGDYYVDDATGNVYGPKNGGVSSPVYRGGLSLGSTGAFSNQSPQSDSLPTVQAGDLLIAVVSCYNTTLPTTPAGWTLASSATTSNEAFYVFTKTAVLADSGATISLTTFGLASNTYAAVAISAYGNVASATIPTPVGTLGQGPISVGATTLGTSDMVLGLGGYFDSGKTAATTASFSAGTVRQTAFGDQQLAAIAEMPNGSAFTVTYTGTAGGEGCFATSMHLTAGASPSQWPLFASAPQPAGLTRYGTGAPGNGVGGVGDYYIDEATGNVYGPKTATASITDSFHRANSSTPGTTDTGQSWTVTGAGTGWQITSNALVPPQNSVTNNVSGEQHMTLASTLGNDLTVQFTYGTVGTPANPQYTGGPSVQLIARGTDESNYYLAGLDGGVTPQTLTIYKCVAGAFTSLASVNVPSTVAAGDTVTFSVIGSALASTLSRSGTVVASVKATDTTFTSGQRIGFRQGYGNESGVTVASFAATPVSWPLLATPPAPVVAGLTRFGTGAPSSGTGNVGDYYIDEATGNLYGPKAAVGPGPTPTYKESYQAAPQPGTAQSIVIPADVAVGDLLIVTVNCGNNTAANSPTVAGWTRLTGATAINSAQVYLSIYARIAVAGDAGSTINAYNTFGMTNQYDAALLTVFSGAGALPSLVGSPTLVAANTASLTATGTTASGNGTLHLAVLAASDNQAEVNNVSFTAGATSHATSTTSARGLAIGTITASTVAGQMQNASNAYYGLALQELSVPAATISSPWPLATTLVANPPPGAGTTKWTAAKIAAYTAAVGDAVPCDTTTATFAVTLPASPVNGSRVSVKWVAGTAAPTVAANAGQTLDSTWAGLGTVGDSVDFSFNSTTNVWEVV